MSFLILLYVVVLQVSCSALGSALCLFLYKHYQKNKVGKEDGREEDKNI